MAKRGFFGSFLRALLIAVVVFFLLFFFWPNTAERYLGASYRHAKTSVDAAVSQTVGQAMAAVKQKLSDPAIQKRLASFASQAGDAFTDEVKKIVQDAGDLTKEQTAKLQKALSDPATVQKLKDAAVKGGDALEQGIDSLVETVKQ